MLSMWSKRIKTKWW